jgi:hypothetical protein
VKVAEQLRVPLRSEGVEIIGDAKVSEYGMFVWIKILKATRLNFGNLPKAIILMAECMLCDNHKPEQLWTSKY